MEKADQLELFLQGRGDFEKKPSSRHFLSYIRGYEKVIIIIICSIVIGVISYSLGVEKGKRIELLRLNSRLDMAAAVKTAPVLAPAPVSAAPRIKVNIKDSNSTATEDDSDSYTIQVASYQSRVAAQKEAERLKKKGLSVLVLSKGKYTILCVGKFPNKEKAKSSLVELRKKYKDCQIRRL